MNWEAYFGGALIALAAIEIFYALRTGKVAYPAFGVRLDRKNKTVFFWILVGYWLLFAGACASWGLSS